MDNKNKLICLLKYIRNNILKEKINIKNINSDKDLIIKGISFDDKNMCYYNYNDIEDILTGLMVSADNYGIYYENKFIGIISVFYQYYKDLSKLEISINIDSDYRNIGIGSICYGYIISKYFDRKDIKSLHLAIREDNIASRKLAEKFGFKIYNGYKSKNYFIDLNNNKIPQIQYLLKKDVNNVKKNKKITKIIE